MRSGSPSRAESACECLPGLSVNAPETQPSAEWPLFVSRLAEFSRVPRESITADARLVGDLGFDSLALAELGLSLREAYETEEHPLELDGRNWGTTTAGDLFEACAGLPRID
jgi:acyl carrier protein